MSPIRSDLDCFNHAHTIRHILCLVNVQFPLDLCLLRLDLCLLRLDLCPIASEDIENK
jgi:hypothetical protein